MGRGPTKSIDWLHVASSSPLDRSVGESPARSAADTRTEDVFAARLFMPITWAAVSEMVHTGVGLCGVERGVGGPYGAAQMSSGQRRSPMSMPRRNANCLQCGDYWRVFGPPYTHLHSGLPSRSIQVAPACSVSWAVEPDLRYCTEEVGGSRGSSSSSRVTVVVEERLG